MIAFPLFYPRRKTMMTAAQNHNVFTLGGAVGGPDAAVGTGCSIGITKAINQWSGDYCGDIRQFAFLLLVDGQFIKYTEKFDIHGAQKAKRKKDRVEVEIGVPAEWWREKGGAEYKPRLASEIEKGLYSMIELLQSKGSVVKSKELLADWGKIKEEYLRDSPALVDMDPQAAQPADSPSQSNLASSSGVPSTASNLMLKLYRNDHYWEAWYADNEVTIHWGGLGERGEMREIPVRSRKGAQSIIEREAQQPRANGYREIEIDQLSPLAIEYPIDGMGTLRDLYKRHKIEELMDECLGWTGLGHCDGGDIGSGTINIFCFVVDHEKALPVITEELKRNHLLEGARIILFSDEDENRVLFPDDTSR
jgi:hypothetical protein